MAPRGVTVNSYLRVHIPGGKGSLAGCVAQSVQSLAGVGSGGFLSEPLIPRKESVILCPFSKGVRQAIAGDSSGGLSKSGSWPPEGEGL